MRVEGLWKHTLDECADSVESHPFHRGVFALSTYQVDQQEVNKELRGSGEDEDGSVPEVGEDSSESPPYTRSGSVRLFENRSMGAGISECELSHQVSTAAVLDTKWTLARPDAIGEAHEGLLGVADASGHVSLHKLQRGANATSWTLQEHTKMRLNSGKVLCLSLDWSDRRYHYPSACAQERRGRVSDASLIVSQSDGSLAYLPSIQAALTRDPNCLPERNIPNEASVDALSDDSSESEDEEPSQEAGSFEAPLCMDSWHAHDHEAWIAAFDTFSNGMVVWSGGDDLALKGWDMRTAIRRGRREPTFANRRSFEGGVTTMQSHWQREHCWAVGSYDANLRIFDARSPLRPVSCLELPGGIWRLKWHPEDPDLLLAGCMHGGFTIVRTDGSADPEIVAQYDEHNSLAYGCDWDRGSTDQKGCRVFSCSFYDKLMCGWDAV